MLYRIVLATLVARASTGKVDEMIRACRQDRNYMLLCLFTHSSKKCTPV